MLDLIIRNATLADGRRGVDIAVKDGRIAELAPAIEADAVEAIDAAGHLVTPPFVDSHFHMDATLSLGLPRMNQSGTLLEGIRLWGELAPTLTPEAIKQRAHALCRWSIARGTLAIRSHVDVSDAALTAVDALLEVKAEIAPWIDLQLVAFPQNGIYRAPRRPGQSREGARQGRRCRRRHPAFRAHHGRRRRLGDGAHRDRRPARPAGRYALRRDRRPGLAPHRDPGRRDRPARAAWPRRRFASDLDALDGQRLRQQAAAADQGRRASRRSSTR